jgi:hypothetical protein
MLNQHRATRKAPRTNIKTYHRKDIVPLVPVTTQEYGGLQKAFSFFNRELFERTLPNCLLTFQRKAHSRGHFSPNRYSGRTGKQYYHELNLNPDAIHGRTDIEVCSTLVHEQVHVWQYHCGKYPSKGYHDRQWGAKMKEIGLYPSNTGTVGGKETGTHMTHYQIPGGRYQKAYAKLKATGWRLNVQSAQRPGPKVKGPDYSKTRFSCPMCRQNAWGKPTLQVSCTIDGLPMPAVTK